MTTEMSINVKQRHLLTIEKLRNRVHQMLKCVINLHIEFLVLESNVNQLIDDVRDFNEELMEVQRLDALISALRNYSGPTICHEWPYPLIFKGTIDDADVAQILNGRQKVGKSKINGNLNETKDNCELKSRSTVNNTTTHELCSEAIEFRN
ncbi:uncharacterized protein LOC101451021 [Ceratitis capitata]|uniref:(Mediterranean fruit fly) hypothetical protein n=1 Tax=Ceratitis capitata TaxID=7213 RepID=A0A811UZI7_CERCA|nr:uncharacterized protein LOC101451021 [Ceratitis capitata]CAD7004041.1 unnamed protein product [Ceratitis capitata]